MPNSHTTRYRYDAQGNLIERPDALGNVTRYSYEPVFNQMTSMTDANGRVTTYEYDARGKLTQTFYDGEGNRVQTIDRNGNATSYQYDLRQRLTQTTDALGQTMKYSYDGNNNRVSATDKNGHTTRFEYDVQNRPSKTTDAVGNTTTMTYDPVGNKLSETDANGHTTTYTYDALNRMKTRTDAEANLTQMLYDMVGLPAWLPGLHRPDQGLEPRDRADRRRRQGHLPTAMAAVTISMPWKILRSSKWASPETIRSACAARAAANTWSSAGSGVMVSSMTAGVTMTTKAA